MTKNFRLMLALGILILPAWTSVEARSGQSQTGLSARQISTMRKHLRKEFGFPLPASAKIMRVAGLANNLVMFVCVKMPVPDAVRFKEKLIDLRRPETQRFLYEGKDSGTHIGTLPAFDNEPASIEEWKRENKVTGGETMIYIQNVRRIGEDELKTLSYLVMFSQESTGLAYFYYYPAKR